MDGIPSPTADNTSLAATVQNNHEPLQSEGKNVNSRITNRQSGAKGKPVRAVAAGQNVRVIQSSLVGPEALALSDDDNQGGDPYNTAGQHVVIKLKAASQD